MPPESVTPAANGRGKIYRFAFEHNPAPMLVTRMEDGRIIDVNSACERWSSATRDELIGESTTDKYQWLSKAQRTKLIDEVTRTGSYSNFSFELLTPGEGHRHCTCSGQSFTLDGEQVLVTIIHDVTDLQHNLDVLQILTGLDDLLAANDDPDTMLTQVMQYLQTTLEVDRAALLTPLATDATELHIAFEAHHPDYPGATTTGKPLLINDDYRRTIVHHLASDLPISYGPDQDLPLQAPMWERQIIQSQLMIALQPVHGEQGLLLLQQCSYPRHWSSADKTLLTRIAARVADRRNTLLLMRDLQQSEQRYRQMFDNAPEAILVFEIGSGKLSNFNPAATEMFGYSKSDLRMMTVFDISPEQQPGGSTLELVKQISIQAAGGQSPRFEWRYIRQDDAEVIAEIQLHRLPDEDNLLRVTAVDITEKRQLEAQLVQAQKMESVGELAGGIAHDFNNLLQGILGFSDLLMEQSDFGDNQRRQLGHIHEAATRAATLTRQLLAFGRRQVLNKQNTDLNSLIGDDLEVMQRALGSHIEVDFIPGNNLGSVFSDPVQIQQIMLNLFLNARDAMPEGGVVTIETESLLITGEYCRTHPWAKPGRYVMISITDTGQGMDHDTLERIFEPFFTTKGSGGSGLGLAMVYGIIKQHDGMIQAYSEPGLGTTFKIYLPQLERPATAVGPKLTGAVTGGGETILIAEDDAAIRELVKTILEKIGYQVIVAVDGEQAIELYRAHQQTIDLIMLDVIMPKTGGKQAYEAIREMNPEVRCLFTSGYSNNGVHTGFVLSEGLKLIQKPYNPSALLRQIRAILDQH